MHERAMCTILMMAAFACGGEQTGTGPGMLAALAANSAFAMVAAGDHHTCAWLDDVVKCWGDNTYGQLGQGDFWNRGDGAGEMGDLLLPIDLDGAVVEEIAAGSLHTCALLDDGRVKCWGENSHGQLGLGDTSHRGDAAGEMGINLPAVDLGTKASGAPRTAKHITAGAFHTCAILDNGQVKCWGENGLGELGLGDTANRGDAAGEMGGALPGVKLGAGRDSKKISAGYHHTCVILDGDEVKCWGSNVNGQLGLGDTNNRGDAAGEMGASLPVVSLGSGHTAQQIAAAGVFTCALLDDKQVKCWGHNDDGELGLGDMVDRGDGANEMGDFLPEVALGAGETAKHIAAAGDHTCVILDTAAVKCWGGNPAGDLGLGDTNDRGDVANEMGDLLPPVDLGTGRTAIGITAGLQHSCALLDDGALKCWGTNLWGQLGLGDTAKRGDGAGEMGDLLPAVDLGTL